jgi:predicted nucleotidyltransferase
MTPDTKKAVADLMVTALLERLGDEVELVFHYGSTVHGDTHRWSDLDFSYVPRHRTTWESITVMVSDILFDLYPLHWDTLERMAEHDDWRATILEDIEVTYARSPEARERLRELAERHRSLEQPDARPRMAAKALSAFHDVGYDYYQLARTARAGDQGASAVHANRIVQQVLHAVVVLNQARADTRKLGDVLALPRVPAGLEALVDGITAAGSAPELLERTDALLDATRALLLAEQAQTQRVPASYPDRLDAAYPELKADLQRVLLACERDDRLAAQTKLFSFLHELHIHLAQAERGVAYSAFNSPDEYRVDLQSRGFPDLAAIAAAGELGTLREACLAFDERLRRYLREQRVSLGCYDSIEELEVSLRKGEV